MSELCGKWNKITLGQTFALMMKTLGKGTCMPRENAWVHERWQWLTVKKGYRKVTHSSWKRVHNSLSNLTKSHCSWQSPVETLRPSVLKILVLCCNFLNFYNLDTPVRSNHFNSIQFHTFSFYCFCCNFIHFI